MPQREFWTEAHPVEVRWRYWSDLRQPGNPGQVSMTVYDQAGKMMEHGSGFVVAKLTHETVGTALLESWEGYLFGEHHAGPQALQKACARYRAHEAHLRQ